MSCLQQLCSLLPFNPWYWFNLGQMCLQLLENRPTSRFDFISCLIYHPYHFLSQLCSSYFFVVLSKKICYLPSLGLCSSKRCESAEEQNDGETEEIQEEAAEMDEDRLRLKASTCFVRTRYTVNCLHTVRHIHTKYQPFYNRSRYKYHYKHIAIVENHHVLCNPIKQNIIYKEFWNWGYFFTF